MTDKTIATPETVDDAAAIGSRVQTVVGKNVVIVCEDKAAARQYAQNMGIPICLTISSETEIPRLALFSHGVFGEGFDVIQLTPEGEYFNTMKWETISRICGIANTDTTPAEMCPRG